MVENVTNNKRALFSLIIISFAYLLSNFHRQSMAIMTPFLMDSLKISESQIGTLGSMVFYAYGLTQIPLGYLTTKIGGRKIIQASLLLLIIGSIVFGNAKSYTELLLGRLLVGLAVSGYYVPSINLIRQWFDIRVFSYYLGLYLAIGNIGSLLSTSPYEYLLKNYSINHIYLVFGVFTSLLFVASLFLKEEKIYKKVDRQKFEDEKLPKGFYLFFITILLYGISFFGARQAFVSLWGTSYYSSYFAFDLKTISFLMMVISIGGIVYSPLSGKIADKIGRYKALVYQSLISVLLWIVSAFVPSSTPIFLLILIAFVLGAINIATMSNAFATVTDFAGLKYSSLCVGIFNTANFFGTAFYMQGLGLYFESNVANKASFRFSLLLFATTIAVSLAINMYFYKIMKDNHKVDGNV